MILIVFGVYNLFFTQSRVFGYILIAVGGFFMIPEIFTVSYDFKRNFWPIILILVGLFIIFRHGFSKREPINMNVDEMDTQFIDEFNVFSGSEKKISMKNFKGGKITSIFGGSEIDLLDTELSLETNVIDIFYLFGGSSIKVPNDWIVINKVTAILGGFADKRHVSTPTIPDPKKTLVLRGFVMFGGGEVVSA
jgi:predicted membrane protein